MRGCVEVRCSEGICRGRDEAVGIFENLYEFN